MNAELPDGWATATFRDISEINPRHPQSLNDSMIVSFAPMSTISETSPACINLQVRPLYEVRKGYTHFAEGDVLFAKITPCMENGKGAVAKGLKNGIGCGTTEIHVIRPLGGINPYYIYRYIHQSSFRRDAEAAFTGTAGQARVPISHIEESKISIPPLKEQQRIVTKLEVLLENVDACQKRLERIPLILKRFRQAVLAAACSGRLTADWRKKHSHQEQPEKILEIIRARREMEVKTQGQLNKIFKIYNHQEKNQSDALPNGWKYVSLAKLCISFDYGTSAKSQKIGNIPVLRMGNIQNGRILWENLVYTSDEKEIQSYLLQSKSVLFNRTNSPELVGKTAIYRGEHPAIFAGYLIRINQYPELDAEYLNLCLNTNYAREFCQSVKTDGVSQSNINAQKLALFEVPFCQLQEQQEIVHRVKALFAVADRIEARYNKAKAQTDKLAQSILAKAFRGELVPQDPNDEPASVLLERIRQERIQKGQGSTSNGKRRAKGTTN